jgi:hypothetical protein
MRLLAVWFPGLLALTVAVGGTAAQTLARDPAPATGTKELVQDLRILTILNVLAPTAEQSTRLAEVAAAGSAGASAIEAEFKFRLEQQRAALETAREALVRGDSLPMGFDAQILSASQATESLKAQRAEALVASLTMRVRGILTPEQADRIEHDLAPTADQPWRRYAAGGPASLGSGAGRLPSDPGKWLKDLRDLRNAAAAGDPQAAVDGFVKKLTRGLRSNTPLLDQSTAAARAIAAQAIQMPPLAFSRQEWVLARRAAKQDLEARNQQRHLEGKSTEVFDPARWLVEQVLLSSRAEMDLRERAELP